MHQYERLLIESGQGPVSCFRSRCVQPIGLLAGHHWVVLGGKHRLVAHLCQGPTSRVAVAVARSSIEGLHRPEDRERDQSRQEAHGTARDSVLIRHPSSQTGKILTRFPRSNPKPLARCESCFYRGRNEHRQGRVLVVGCCEDGKVGSVEAGEFEGGSAGEVRGVYELPVGKRGIELRCVVDGVAVIDAVGHSDGERPYFHDGCLDLRSGVAGVEKDQQRRGVRGSNSMGEGFGGHDDAFVVFIDLVFENDEVFVAVAEKWTMWGRTRVMPSRRSVVVVAGRTSSSIWSHDAGPIQRPP